MVLKKLLFIFVILSLGLDAQKPEGKWQDYFSYFHILDIIEQENRLVCATENGLFTYDKNSAAIEKISKVHGLHGVKISTVAYNEAFDYLFVAYQNGAFDVLTPDGIEYFVDIPIDTDFQGDKAVNHIYSIGDKAVFSMDFGIVIFDLANLEFDETTYFRVGSDYYVVNEAVILNNEVIACSENGIYTHPIEDLIPNFNAWLHYFPGVNFQQAEVYEAKAYLGNPQNIYSTENTVDYSLVSAPANCIDLNAGLGGLAVVYPNQVMNYNAQGVLQNSSTFGQTIQTGIISSVGAFGGTQKIGLLHEGSDEGIAPDGPYSNISYKLTLFEDQIYVAPGGRKNFYLFNVINLGYYHFDGMSWNNIPPSSLNASSLMQIAINPLNPEEAYIASYRGLGVTVTENNIPVQTWTQNNSSILGLPELNPWIAIICSNVFDSNGVFYAVEGFSNNLHWNHLNIKDVNNQWINIPLPLPIESTSMITIDSKNWLWIGSPRTGGKMVAYNTNGTPLVTSDDAYYVLSKNEGDGNLPSDEGVTCIAEDKNGTIWIGTTQGIRYKRNPHSSLENEDYDTDLVVVEQAGIPEEFLKDVTVLDIAVDEGNNKWIATSGGVFFVNANATETRAFFDYDNSPLPSSFIRDIEIEPNTGKVYFASSDGIVSYQGDYIITDNSFGEIVVYPNPVRPDFQDKIVIKGLAQNAKVKITDINGNLVHYGTAKGGVLEWDQHNLQGNKVASGVYLALMLNQNNLVSATAKFAIVR